MKRTCDNCGNPGSIRNSGFNGVCLPNDGSMCIPATGLHKWKPQEGCEMTTKRAPQCTTYAQLHEHMARVYKMCEGTSVTVSSCVRKNGGHPTRWGIHPVFNGIPEEFEFALGIVEGKPVFRGDVLYQNVRGLSAFVIGDLAKDGMFVDERGVWCIEQQNVSWNPPRRTIKIGDVEVPAPKEVRYHSAFSNTIELEFLSHDDAFIAKAALEGKKP